MKNEGTNQGTPSWLRSIADGIPLMDIVMYIVLLCSLALESQQTDKGGPVSPGDIVLCLV